MMSSVGFSGYSGIDIYGLYYIDEELNVGYLLDLLANEISLDIGDWRVYIESTMKTQNQ